MSLAGPTAPPFTCSGDMNPGVPTCAPARVMAVPSSGRAIPKSITLGPPEVRITFAGFRSRCTTPASWIAATASASPVASARTAPAGIPPNARTASWSEGPGR
jgi:hypothetical protein